MRCKPRPGRSSHECVKKSRARLIAATSKRFPIPGEAKGPTRVGTSLAMECIMRMFSLKNFASEEDGAVTVDWVVLTAAVVALVGIAMAGIKGNMSSVGQNVQNYLSSVSVP